MRNALLLPLVCAAALTAAAQVQEKVNVNLVEVPVSVVDAAGNPIPGLTAANFHVAEDGQARAIPVFDVLDYAATPSLDAAARSVSPAARRTFHRIP